MTWDTLNPRVTASQVPLLRAKYAVVLLHFGAVWNASDREMDRRLCEVANLCKGHAFVGAVDIDEEQSLAAGFHIMTNPTLACSIRGGEWKLTVGMRSGSELRALLEEAITQAIGRPYRVEEQHPVGMRLKQYWKSNADRWYRNGVKLRPPASEREISHFETKYGVILTEDMRAYFAQVDGFQPYTSEGELLFSFWQLSRVRPIPEEYPDPATRASDRHWPVPDSDSYFCFADYLIESEVFAIRLSADPTEEHRHRL